MWVWGSNHVKEVQEQVRCLYNALALPLRFYAAILDITYLLEVNRLTGSDFESVWVNLVGENNHQR